MLPDGKEMILDYVQVLVNQMNVAGDRIEVLDDCDKILGSLVKIQAEFVALMTDLVDVLSESVVVIINSFWTLWFAYCAGAGGGHYGGREWASAANTITKSNRTGEFLGIFSLCVSSNF